MKLRSHSLYWTFAGSFLLVLVLATVLQGVVVVWIVRPVLQRSLTARAELAAFNAAERLAQEWPADTDLAQSEVASILRAGSDPEAGVLLGYEDRAGWTVPPRGGGPGLRRREFAPPGPGSRRSPMQTVTRVEVRTRGVVRGEVVAHVMAPRFGGWSRGFLGVVFLPLAVLLAGVAALVMFRMFVRRVRALEELALRVSHGDLEVRVEDHGTDEIGRLAESLNSMTARLALARETLEGNDRQRRQLFADITHELATPLTSIRGYAETLRNPQIQLSQTERARYLDHVEEASIRMGLLLDDLLELTRLEAGVVPMELELLDLSELCRNTLARHVDHARRRELHLEGIGLDVACPIHADGRRLEQVVDNLLGNALRYVPAGGRIELTLAQGEDGIALRVQDDGPGFPPADLPQVFDRFYRADTARSTDGTGLGLAIVREIVRAHGGEASAENRAPHGASVVVRLPR